MHKRFQVDEAIGDYRVTRFLGQGGMGEVYHGVHQKLGRPAAIKILGGAALEDPAFKTRFFNEARLQAALHHPNIAALYDFREEGDQLFIFMEFVDGECLDELIKQRRLAVEDALNIFLNVCEALAYIHRNDVVHRDIKSQNIKLTSDGRPKLLDFGIAKDSSSHGLTQTGGVIGTPHYLAPEQLDGKPASPQTDIWALGVLLYEMLAGDVPFSGDSLASLILKITVAEFTSPEKINPAVPADVSKIVRKCLQKDPARRYRCVDDIIGDVRAALDRRHAPAEGHGIGAIAGFGRFGRTQATALPRTEGGNFQQEVSAPPAEARRRTSAALIVGGSLAIFAVLAALTGISIWALSGAAVRSQAGDQATNTITNSAASLSSKAGLQRVRVDVDEGRAQVLKDGKVLGNTPYDLEAGRGETVNLTLRREGFEDKNVNIEITGGKKVFTFSLKSKN